MKNSLKMLLALLLVISFSVFTYSVVKADSGWDVSYDSSSSYSGGGSYSSGGSSWGSSSDYSSGSSYDYSSGSSSGSGNGSFSLITLMIFMGIYFLIFIAIIITIINYGIKNRINKIREQEHNKELEKEIEKRIDYIYELKQGNTMNYDSDYVLAHQKELEDRVIKVYIDVQNAWMNFDYEALKSLVTDEMYNMYQVQLKVLESKKQKNIMTDIQANKIKIFYYVDEKNITTMKAILNISMYDYVVNSSSVVVRGSNKKKVNVTYELEFIKYNDVSKKCPNCGAKLKKNNSECEYCNTKIVKGNNDFVLSKKENIYQK